MSYGGDRSILLGTHHSKCEQSGSDKRGVAAHTSAGVPDNK